MFKALRLFGYISYRGKYERLMKYTVVIKYLGQYYVQKESKNSSQLEFPAFELISNKNYSASDFVQSNVNIKKDIAKEIIHKTPFRNSKWAGANAYKAVSLQKVKVRGKEKRTQKIKIVIFKCNELSDNKKNEFIPYIHGLKKWCNPMTKKILGKLKFQNNWSTYLFYGLLLLMFLPYLLPGIKFPFNCDALPFIYSALGVLISMIRKVVPTDKYFERFNNCPFMGNIPLLYFVLFVGMFLLSLYLSFYVPDICNPTLSKIGLLVLIAESAIGVYSREV